MPDPSSVSPQRAAPLWRVSRWLFTATPASRRVCLWLGAGALVVLFTTILCAGRSLAYDEVFHLTTVQAFFRLGLSRGFLMGTPWSSPGPLYAFLQGAAAPLTGLRPPGIRLVNFACALGMVALLALALRARGVAAPGNVALGILAAPVGWIVFALALTEAPAMLCAAGSLWLTVLWQRAELRPARRDALAVAAGLLLGGAIIGRQVYLAVIPAVGLLAQRGTWRPTLLQMAAALLLPVPLFAVWGGLNPPTLAFLDHGLRPSSVLLAYAYTGLTALLLAARFFDLRSRWMLWTAGTLFFVNLIFGLYTYHLPVGVLSPDQKFPGVLSWLTTRLWGTALLVLAGTFAVAALKNFWDRREDRIFLFTCAATLLLAITPIKITHTWDVRYTSVLLPFLVVALGDAVTHNFARAIRLALGMCIAALYLHHCLKVHWDETHPPTMREIFASILPKE